MRRLNVFATPEEIAAMKLAANAPAIALQCGPMPMPSALEIAHRSALAHGLPEITGYYGCDLRTGAFVSVDEP